MTDYDIIDGRRVPGTVITSDQIITDTHNGSVHVVGCELVISGTLNGSLKVSDGGVVRVLGTHNGSTLVGSRCQLDIAGSCNGSTNIQSGATVLVEPAGRLAGSMLNDGTLVIWGVFGGAYQGHGIRTLEGNGHIKQPVIRDGITFYEW